MSADNVWIISYGYIKKGYKKTSEHTFLLKTENFEEASKEAFMKLAHAARKMRSDVRFKNALLFRKKEETYLLKESFKDPKKIMRTNLKEAINIFKKVDPAM